MGARSFVPVVRRTEVHEEVAEDFHVLGVIDLAFSRVQEVARAEALSAARVIRIVVVPKPQVRWAVSPRKAILLLRLLGAQRGKQFEAAPSPVLVGLKTTAHGAMIAPLVASVHLLPLVGITNDR